VLERLVRFFPRAERTAAAARPSEVES